MTIHKYVIVAPVFKSTVLSYKIIWKFINPFTSRVSYGDTEVILTFESVDEIQSHSNETSSAVLSHSTIYI